MNIWDIIIAAVISLIIIAAVRNIIKNKKSGKCSCGCDGCTRKCKNK